MQVKFINKPDTEMKNNDCLFRINSLDKSDDWLTQSDDWLRNRVVIDQDSDFNKNKYQTATLLIGSINY